MSCRFFGGSGADGEPIWGPAARVFGVDPKSGVVIPKGLSELRSKRNDSAIAHALGGVYTSAPPRRSRQRVTSFVGGLCGDGVKVGTEYSPDIAGVDRGHGGSEIGAGQGGFGGASQVVHVLELDLHVLGARTPWGSAASALIRAMTTPVRGPGDG